ncbi:MAG TPA: hypothetical protein VHV57_12940 [Acidimicrobiales bacterium]|nr:hypothetical protein [Acidimicrobiales bacterium]
MRRNLIPQALLALLTVLTIGAVVLSVRAVPDAATEAVHSATAATFGSPAGSHSVSLTLESNVSAGQGAGTLTQILRITYVAPDTMTVYRASAPAANLGPVAASKIAGTLKGYAAVTGGPTPWTGTGSQFRRTESLAPFSLRVYQKKALPGTVTESVTVKDGYLVSIHFTVVVDNQNSAVGETYRIISIGGKPVAAVAP